MKTTYSLEDIDTRNTDAVSREVVSLFTSIFPGEDASRIPVYFSDVEDMFAGKYRDYHAMDTSYHDLEHTYQATLCFIRLITQRQRAGATPAIDPHLFEAGLVAILFHDMGYLKKRSDTEGTGAKFTFVHERRSCEFVDVYLSDRGWDKEDIFSVQHLISCTGPRSIIDSIPFNGPIERTLGEAVCTADYLGQMSDPGYVDKLPVLFEEFEESDNHRGIDHGDRMFQSVEDLMRSTPFFWHKIVIPKLQKDCHGLYKFLADPYPDGPNPYMERVEHNISKVRAILDTQPPFTATA